MLTNPKNLVENASPLVENASPTEDDAMKNETVNDVARILESNTGNMDADGVSAERQSITAEIKPDTEQVNEIMSDGSASAFEGTEFRDQDDRDQELLKRIRKQSDPSGRSDY